MVFREACYWGGGPPRGQGHLGMGAWGIAGRGPGDGGWGRCALGEFVARGLGGEGIWAWERWALEGTRSWADVHGGLGFCLICAKQQIAEILSPAARLAQSAERKALNLVVVVSSPTVGVDITLSAAQLSWQLSRQSNSLVVAGWRLAPRFRHFL